MIGQTNKQRLQIYIDRYQWSPREGLKCLVFICKLHHKFFPSILKKILLNIFFSYSSESSLLPSKSPTHPPTTTPTPRPSGTTASTRRVSRDRGRVLPTPLEVSRIPREVSRSPSGGRHTARRAESPRHAYCRNPIYSRYFHTSAKELSLCHELSVCSWISMRS